MIASIREHFEKWGKIVIWLIIISMALGAVLMSFNTSKRIVDSVATINGFDITRREYHTKLQQEAQLMTLLRQQFGPGFEALLGTSKKTEERVLDTLIKDKLLQSATQDMNLHVSSDVIAKKLEKQDFLIQALSDVVPMEALYGQGGVNMQAISHYLQRQGISDEEFEEIVARAIKNQLLTDLIASTSYVPAWQVKHAYVQQYVPKKYGIATLPLDTYIARAKKNNPTIADKDLHAYYVKNSATYQIPEKRSAVVWTFSAPDYSVIVNEKDISEYYTKNKRRYSDKPERFAVRILEVPVAEKADEAILKKAEIEAQELSKKANKELFEKKGAVVDIARDGKDKAQVNAAFALKNDGDVSGVVRTKTGFQVIQRVSRKEPTFKPLDSVKEEIAAELKQDKFLKQFAVDAQRIMSQVQQDPSILQKFVVSKKAKQEAVNKLEQDGSMRAQKAFALKAGGKAFYTEGKNGYIVELKDITPTQIPSLESLKEKVTADYYAHLGKELLDKALYEGLVKVNNGAPLASIAKELQATYEETGWLDPQDPKSYAAVEKQNIPVDRLKNLASVHGAIEEFSDKAGYLIEVLDMKPVEEQAFADKKERITQELERDQSYTLQNAFIEQLRKKADITLSPELKKYSK